MANSDTLRTKLTNIANAIRTKTGGSAELSLDDMVTEIENFSSGAGYVEVATVDDIASVPYEEGLLIVVTGG